MNLSVLFARVNGQLYRRSLFLKCRYIPLWARLHYQLRIHPSPRHFFLNRIQRLNDRFSFSDNVNSLVSVPISGLDPVRVADGFAQVISEMYARPMLYWKWVHPSIGQTVLDIGANIGTTALALAKSVGQEGVVHAFEPIAYETLTRNVRANHLNNIIVYPIAIGSYSGEAEMIINAFGLDNHISYRQNVEDNQFQKQIVKITNLDEWDNDQRIETIDFIKLDVEGSEEDVILGAKRLIARCHPMWSIATEHVGPDGQHTHRKIVSILRSFGYFTKEIGNDYVYAWFGKIEKRNQL